MNWGGAFVECDGAFRKFAGVWMNLDGRFEEVSKWMNCGGVWMNGDGATTDYVGVNDPSGNDWPDH